MSDKKIDELFENDFFKDKFDTRVEKHLKSLKGYSPQISSKLISINTNQTAELRETQQKLIKIIDELKEQIKNLE